MDPEKMMEGLTSELAAAIKAMGKAKGVEEKLAYSKIIKNLTKSLGVFLSLAQDMMDESEEFDYDEE